MPLNLPMVDDIKLDRAPLEEVICQVRHPPILKIGHEDPVDFQDLIRQEFPNIEFEQGLQIEIPKPGQEGIIAAKPSGRTYRFRSEDGNTLLSLAVDFYAVSTRRYLNWEEFSRIVCLAHNSFVKVYGPSFSTRVGLRYVNRFTLENTGLTSLEDILSIVRPELTANSESEVWSSPIEFRNRLVFKDDGSKFTIQVSFDNNDDTPFFILDFDYFDEGHVDLVDLEDRVNLYHDIIYRAFRWCILDDALEIFGRLD